MLVSKLCQFPFAQCNAHSSWGYLQKSVLELWSAKNKLASQIFHQITALPLEMYMLWNPLTWTLGLNGCKLMSLITEMVAYVSILTVSAFTFERFTAICYPLRPSLHSDLKRSKIIILIIWIVSLVPSGFLTSYVEVCNIITEI